MENFFVARIGDCSTMKQFTRDIFKILESPNTTSIILHKKWSFPLRNSPVNVTKSAVSYGFGDNY